MDIYGKLHNTFNARQQLYHFGTIHDRHWWFNRVNENRMLELSIDRQRRYKKIPQY